MVKWVLLLVATIVVIGCTNSSESDQASPESNISGEPVVYFHGEITRPPSLQWNGFYNNPDENVSFDNQ